MRSPSQTVSLCVLLLLAACQKESPEPFRASDVLEELVAGMAPCDPAAPGRMDTAGRAVLSADWCIRVELRDLSGAKLLLNCFSEHLPPGARIHARLPDAAELWPGFEGAVLDRKAEFFLRFPPGLPRETVLELELRDAGEHELRIQAATLERPPRPPSVAMIVIDTLRPDYLACYGHPTVHTPNIDSLAAEGILFENAFAHIPITGPSHAALFQSRTPTELGLLNNHGGILPDGVPTLAESLERAGLRGAASVSISAIEARFGFDRGFAEYDDRLGSNWIVRGDVVTERVLSQLAASEDRFFLLAHLSDPHEPYDAHGLVEKHATVFLDGVEIGRTETTSYSNLEIELELPSRPATLRIESAQPFFVRRASFLGPREEIPKLRPRIPFWEPATERETTVTAEGIRHGTLALGLHDELEDDTLLLRYAREVEFVDRQVGRILAALRERGAYDDSWIVFTADHGEGLGCHDHIGHVQNLYDCLVRVPLILKPPRAGSHAAGLRRVDVASLMDVAPTLLGVLGIERPASMRGEDLLARDEQARREASVFLETHAPQAEHTKYGLRTRDAKIVWTPETDRWEFYDLSRDPGETENLIDDGGPAAFPLHARFQESLRRIQAAATETGPELPVDESTREILQSLGYVR